MPPLRWMRNRGRNGWDSAIDVPEEMSTETLNCHFFDGGLGTRRSGSVSTGTLTGMSGINALFAWLPGQNETARELFLVDDSATNQFLRIAAGSTAVALTVGDTITSNDTVVSFAALNGKLHIAYDSSVNRLKIFDPGLSTTALRWSGMGTTAAPTAANTGAGTYTATIRYYRVAFTEQRNSVTVRRGELSPALSFTPSGAGSAVRVTKPASLSSGETHWELYGSTDDAEYFLLATTAVGTTTVDDSAALSTYADNTAAPIAGENTPFPSVKFLYSDGKTLFGFGVWETSAGDSHTPQAGTVYYTPALDTSSVYDDERCRNGVSPGRLILGRNAGGIDRGIGGLGNLVYAFQSKGIYQLTPTENPDIRFRRTQISDDLGAVSHDSIIKGIDQNGKPALYFLDPTYGPYRIGQRGIEWAGKDVKDLWDTVNLAATNKIAWAQPIPEIGGIVFAFATGSSNDPDTVLFYDPTEARYDEQGDLRGGWAKWTGDLCAARCATLMSATLGASMSRNLTLYVGASTGTTLLKYDATAEDDNGTDFQAYVQSKAWDVEPIYQDKALQRSYVLATASAGVTITQTLIRNFEDETPRDSTASLTPTGGETRTLQKFDDAALAEAFTFQVRLGDGAAQASSFTLDRWYGELTLGGIR